MRVQGRTEALMRRPACGSAVRHGRPVDRRLRGAARRLVELYAGLAGRGEHLLQALLDGSAPRQWSHYPEDDAVDRASGFQWFYHSHSPEDRDGTAEHGHFHLFARRALWARRLRSKAEQAFAAATGAAACEPVATRHLVCLGIDAKGVPVSLFTVNSWVTGDLMLSAPLTQQLLDGLSLDTGHAAVDAMICAVVGLCRDEIGELLARRDAVLAASGSTDVLQDESLEVLSTMPIDIDRKLSAWL